MIDYQKSPATYYPNKNKYESSKFKFKAYWRIEQPINREMLRKFVPHFLLTIISNTRPIS